MPLFVEELTKTVLESGLLAEAGDRYELAGPLPPLAIPATLHDSLMARLDRLAPVKEVAQIGAVIGREFSHELLAAAGRAPDGRVSSATPSTSWSPPSWSSAAARRPTRPTASSTRWSRTPPTQSLLNKRQQLHARIARVLEERFPERVTSQPEVLAHHYGAAGHMEKAFQYSFEAGRRAAERSANAEAIEHLTKAREALANLSVTRSGTDVNWMC